MKFWEKKFFCHIFSKIHKIVHKVPFTPKKGKVYFRYCFNFSKKSRLFLYDLPFFSQFYENFGPKKPFFFLIEGTLTPPQKRGKGVKRVLHVLFLKVNPLDLPHPKYWPPIINRGKVIQNGGFYPAIPPHVTLVSPWVPVPK